MNDLKPTGTVGWEEAKRMVYWRDKIPEEGTKLYAIPDTHRVVSAELLRRIEADVSPFSHYALKEELRAIIDNKEQQS